MVFCSMIFVWIFLPATVTVYYLSKKAWRNAILLFVSLLFYAWGEPVYIFLMLTSIGINYVAGILIEKGDHVKEILMIAAILDFGILGYYKYFNFLISTVNRIFRLNISSREIALPIGISFFTFQAFSYVVDVYRKECKAEKNIVNMALYISFFPQLIAGPIVKYSDINMQIKRRNESMENIADGVRRFCYGLGKKVIVANILAEVVDKIAMMDIVNVTGIMAWIVMVFYSLQIYYDFSGYSDMAIGLAGIFGFRIKENFNYPYLSGSIREFWRRWHISLSTWFREYVYIPLGGNREGGVKHIVTY